MKTVAPCGTQFRLSSSSICGEVELTDPLPSREARKLTVRVDAGSSVPLYRQISDFVWVEVASGSFETGDRLPTVRQAAIDLGVHPDTVSRAYKELDLLGVVVQRGEGTFVGLKPSAKKELEGRNRLEGICRDAVSRAEQAGFSFDDVVDALADLRPTISNQSRNP